MVGHRPPTGSPPPVRPGTFRPQPRCLSMGTGITSGGPDMPWRAHRSTVEGPIDFEVRLTSRPDRLHHRGQL